MHQSLCLFAGVKLFMLYWSSSLSFMCVPCRVLPIVTLAAAFKTQDS